MGRSQRRKLCVAGTKWPVVSLDYSMVPDGLTMIDSSALRAFRDTLAMAPVDWVLWALDEDERYVFLEGPCLERIGVRAAEKLGRGLVEANVDTPQFVEWGRKYMTAPGSDQVVYNGHTLLLSGAPSRDGGSVGIGMLLDAARPVEPCPVMELACDVPRAGARRGDLVVVDPARPGRVGLYREIDLGLFPTALENEVREISTRLFPAAPRATPLQSGERRPARAAHLRLLP